MTDYQSFGLGFLGGTFGGLSVLVVYCIINKYLFNNTDIKHSNNEEKKDGTY